MNAQVSLSLWNILWTDGLKIRELGRITETYVGIRHEN